MTVIKVPEQQSTQYLIPVSIIDYCCVLEDHALTKAAAITSSTISITKYCKHVRENIIVLDREFGSTQLVKIKSENVLILSQKLQHKTGFFFISS